MAITIGSNNLSKIYVGPSEVSKIYLGQVEIYSAEEEDTCLTFSSPSSFTLETHNASKNWDGTLEYSTDKNTWSTWNGSQISAASDGTNYMLYLRGSNNTYITGSTNANGRFVFTGSSISCSGNIETLLDYDKVSQGEHPVMASYCYQSMFYNCTGLTSVPALPATTLTESCYRSMFDGCTGLTSVPALPATTLKQYCYREMFRVCTGIKLSETQTGEYVNEYRIPTSGTGTTGTLALYNMFGSTGGTFIGTPTINTTYYTSNEVI